MTQQRTSYLHALLESEHTQDNDVLSVKVGELKQFKQDCMNHCTLTPKPSFLPTDEACIYYNVAMVTLYKWLRNGVIQGKKQGHKWLVKIDTIK